MATTAALDRSLLCDRYLRNRRRTRSILATVRPEAYCDRPISLRNPICFYEGHLPAFSVNTLIRRGLGRPGVNAKFEALFERGIDPEDEAAVAGGKIWPPREAILAYGDAADRIVFEALAEADIENEESPVLREGLAAWTILEHEAMHQETLDYMWRRLPYEKKVRPADAPGPETGGKAPRPETVRIPAGRATLRRGQGRNPVRLGQRVSAACGGRARLFDRRAQRHQRRVSRIRGERRLRPRKPRARASPVLGAAGRSLGLARTVGEGGPAHRVARLGQPRRGRRLRALEGRASSDRGRVSPGRLRHA